jgi:hypothetical protein
VLNLGGVKPLSGSRRLPGKIGIQHEATCFER